jgi:DNA-binding NtrC family response regulator
VGGQRDVSANARLIVTSSRDLSAEVEEDRFRGDLHYRLSTMVLNVPAVRERSDADRLLLITSLHSALASRTPEPPLPFAPESLERLMTHGWPGNVRELAGVVERRPWWRGRRGSRPS